MSVVVAPWTNDQVVILESYQNNNKFHSYVCENGHKLVPTNDGWICALCPEYTQDWCCAFHFIAGRRKLWLSMMDEL